jgi:UrcA family protein
MKRPLKIAFGSFLATAALIKAAPVFAEPVQPQNIQVVHTADLDLSTSEGRRALDQRLVIAAGEVCGTAADFDLAGKNADRRCRKDALARARASGEVLASNGTKREILVAAGR